MNEADQAKVRKCTIGLQMVTIEWDVTATQQKLQEIRSKFEKTQSWLELQLENLQAEMQALVRDLNESRSKFAAVKATMDTMKVETGGKQAGVVETEKKASATIGEQGTELSIGKTAELESSDANGVLAGKEDVVSTEESQEEVAVESSGQEVDSFAKPDVAESNQEISREIEQEVQPSVAEVEAIPAADVTSEEIEKAVFLREFDRVVFRKAFSDIGNQQAVTRADAARAMGGIRHELSLKALAGQFRQEASEQVRRECVKAVAALQMKEGLAILQEALSDKAASVRLTAVWGLYNSTGIESVPSLAKMFSDEDEEVRRRAITCISWLYAQQAPVEAMKDLQIRELVPVLVARLGDSAMLVRTAALNALEKVTGKKMEQSAENDENPHKGLVEQWRQWWANQLFG